MYNATLTPPVAVAPPTSRDELLHLQWNYEVSISDHGKRATDTHAVVRRFERLFREERQRGGMVVDGRVPGGLLLASVRAAVRDRMFPHRHRDSPSVRAQQATAADWAVVRDLSYEDSGLVLCPARRGYWAAR